MRGSWALVMIPKFESLMFPFGLLNCVWVNTLKNSARKSNPMDSVMRVLLDKPKSVLLNPGPWKNRRLAVPNVPNAQFCTNAPKVGTQGSGNWADVGAGGMK